MVDDIASAIEDCFESDDVFRRNSLLLLGASGTGKSFLASTISKHVNSVFIDCSQMILPSEKEVEGFLMQRICKARPCDDAGVLVVLDSLETIMPRAAMNVVERRSSFVVFEAIRKLLAISKVFVLATSISKDALRVDAVDHMFLWVLELSSLADQGRTLVLKKFVREMNFHLSDEEMLVLCKKLKGYNVGDMRKLVVQTMLEKENEDERIGFQDLMLASDDVKPSTLQDCELIDSSITLSDVAGMDEAKRVVEAGVISVLRNPEKARRIGLRLPSSICITGPSGCGKTHLALAVAGETGLSVLNVKGPNIISAVVGQSEKTLKELFEKAKDAAPCLILVDQLDAIAPSTREGEKLTQTQNRLISCLASEMDQCAEGVIMIATVEDMSRCHYSIVNRIVVSIRLSHVVPEQIVRFGLERANLEEDERWTEEDVQEICKHCWSKSVAKICATFNEARVMAVREDGSHAKLSLSMIKKAFAQDW